MTLQEAADKVRTLVQRATEGLLCGSGSDDGDDHMGVTADLERGNVEAAQQLAEAWQNYQLSLQDIDPNHGAHEDNSDVCCIVLCM